MALGIKSVQGSRQVVGPGMWKESWLLIPGTSDYVTSGYTISNVSLSCSKIKGVAITGVNATVTAGTYHAYPVFTFAQVGSGGPGVVGYTSFLWQVFVLTTTPTYAEVAGSGNLSGCIWQITVESE